uniref:Lipase maturation factor n=1 Tax=Chromera velia CCMP2878 TaxID=1169474 RepID=A0A0K6S895_9ALVE|eukprot:Cvel_24687.t1-p1 / transcript=Cvel_24687.t1 / gene=Cvel_24687 / organism=Chromera_velia_CCMP2878 / gene_product=Lipase maturation factor 1, putative / transcript_product=Lipase maturation factor 1, putative / location=Cvel_scaffold2705:362-9842(+) / protein_length=876 / sequence_SO=supercontig / SO=protein_coding / is_pseudo=false
MSETTLDFIEVGMAFISFVIFWGYYGEAHALIFSKGILPAKDLFRKMKTLQSRNILGKGKDEREGKGEDRSSSSSDFCSLSLWDRLRLFRRCPLLLWLFSDECSDAALELIFFVGFSSSGALLLLRFGIPAAGLVTGGAVEEGLQEESFPLWIEDTVFGLFALGSPLFWFCSYASHLSLQILSGPFLGLQFDSNVSELEWLLSFGDVLVLWQLRWFVFRLMTACGAVKWFGSPMWKEGTAMMVHYETQPLPNSFSRIAHLLPAWWHKAETWATLVIEGLVPLLIFSFVSSLRLLAFFVLSGFQVMINLTGNFGQLGLQVFIEMLSVLDDSQIRLLFPFSHRLFKVPPWQKEKELASGFDMDSLLVAQRNAGHGQSPLFLSLISMLRGFCVFVCLLSAVGWLSVAVLHSFASLAPFLESFKGRVRVPEFCERLSKEVKLWRICNYYGKFGSMSEERFELVVEGSNANAGRSTDEVPLAGGKGLNGILKGSGASLTEWKRINIKYKPSDPNRRPPCLGLFLPRFAWRVWFLPGPAVRLRKFGWTVSDPPEWYARFQEGLLRNDPASVSLIDLPSYPFKSAPPKQVRTVIKKFTFRKGAEASREEGGANRPNGKEKEDGEQTKRDQEREKDGHRTVESAPVSEKNTSQGPTRQCTSASANPDPSSSSSSSSSSSALPRSTERSPQLLSREGKRRDQKRKVRRDSKEETEAKGRKDAVVPAVPLMMSASSSDGDSEVEGFLSVSNKPLWASSEVAEEEKEEKEGEDGQHKSPIGEQERGLTLSGQNRDSHSNSTDPQSNAGSSKTAPPSKALNTQMMADSPAVTVTAAADEENLSWGERRVALLRRLLNKELAVLPAERGDHWDTAWVCRYGPISSQREN